MESNKQKTSRKCTICGCDTHDKRFHKNTNSNEDPPAKSTILLPLNIDSEMSSSDQIQQEDSSLTLSFDGKPSPDNHRTPTLLRSSDVLTINADNMENNAKTLPEIETCSLNEYVLTPVSPDKWSNIIDIQTVRTCVNNYATARRPLWEKRKCNLNIDSEYSEYTIEEATGGKHIGAGNCPMDIRTPNNNGIDVTSLCLNGKKTNEKSIIQNFKESGNQLDVLFAKKQDVEAVGLFMKDLKRKWETAQTLQTLNGMYYVCFISTKTNIYLAVFRINVDSISSVESAGFVKSTTEMNITLRNFIDDKIGTVTLYKSKKRVELRLLSNIVSSKYAVELFSL